MTKLYIHNMLLKRAISWVILMTFSMSSFVLPSQAQSLPIPTLIGLTPAYVPVFLKGVVVSADNPFQFNFIVDPGHSGLKDQYLKEETIKLIRYFLATITVPEDDQWVNLSPYEKDRIVPTSFGQTEMGRDLLAQDYILKQLTASLMYPEGEVGKKFWERIQKIAQEKFGINEVPINTFNKVWILPQKASVYEDGNVAIVTSARLKVMLEEDYLALQATKDEGLASPAGGRMTKDVAEPLTSNGQRPTSYILRPTEHETTEIIRSIILPELEREINEGKHFAPLRQIYYSMILASWYKDKLKNSILSKSYVNQNKIAGVGAKDPQEVQRIYQQYVEAFKKGTYDYIKEDYDANTQQIISRKYFAGGADMAALAKIRSNDSDLNLSQIAPTTKEGFIDFAVLAKPTNENRKQITISEADKKLVDDWVRVLFDEVREGLRSKTEISNSELHTIWGERLSSDLLYILGSNVLLPDWIKSSPRLAKLESFEQFAYFGKRLNQEWGKLRGGESLYPYLALLDDEFQYSSKLFYDISNKVNWMLNGADLKDKSLSLWIRGVKAVMHLRTLGMHGEINHNGKPVFMDNAIIVKTFRRMVRLLIEIKEKYPEIWNKKIPAAMGNAENQLEMTLGDFMLYGLRVMMDPNVHNVENFLKTSLKDSVNITAELNEQRSWRDGTDSMKYYYLRMLAPFNNVSDQKVSDLLLDAFDEKRNALFEQVMKSPESVRGATSNFFGDFNKFLSSFNEGLPVEPVFAFSLRGDSNLNPYTLYYDRQLLTSHRELLNIRQFKERFSDVVGKIDKLINIGQSDDPSELFREGALVNRVKKDSAMLEQENVREELLSVIKKGIVTKSDIEKIIGKALNELILSGKVNQQSYVVKQMSDNNFFITHEGENIGHVVFYVHHAEIKYKKLDSTIVEVSFEIYPQKQGEPFLHSNQGLTTQIYRRLGFVFKGQNVHIRSEIANLLTLVQLNMLLPLDEQEPVRKILNQYGPLIVNNEYVDDSSNRGQKQGIIKVLKANLIRVLLRRKILISGDKLLETKTGRRLRHFSPKLTLSVIKEGNMPHAVVIESLLSGDSAMSSQDKNAKDFVDSGLNIVAIEKANHILDRVRQSSKKDVVDNILFIVDDLLSGDLITDNQLREIGIKIKEGWDVERLGNFGPYFAQVFFRDFELTLDVAEEELRRLWLLSSTTREDQMTMAWTVILGVMQHIRIQDMHDFFETEIGRRPFDHELLVLAARRFLSVVLSSTESELSQFIPILDQQGQQIVRYKDVCLWITKYLLDHRVMDADRFQVTNVWPGGGNESIKEYMKRILGEPILILNEEGDIFTKDGQSVFVADEEIDKYLLEVVQLTEDDIAKMGLRSTWDVTVPAIEWFKFQSKMNTSKETQLAPFQDDSLRVIQKFNPNSLVLDNEKTAQDVMSWRLYNLGKGNDLEQLGWLKLVRPGLADLLDQGSELGGVDLTRKKLNLEVQNSPGFAFEFNFEGVENGNLEGLTPVIINMTPLPSILPLLGFNQKTQPPRLVFGNIAIL